MLADPKPATGFCATAHAAQRPHHIRAQHLADVLALRKANPAASWHAISNSTEAGDCGHSFRSSYQYLRYLEIEPTPLRPTISCLAHGYLHRVVKRTLLLRGPKEVKRTWGVGFKALMAEISGKVGK